MTTTSELDTKTIHELLRAVGLRALVDQLDDVVALATKHRWIPVQLLDHTARLGCRAKNSDPQHPNVNRVPGRNPFDNPADPHV